MFWIGLFILVIYTVLLVEMILGCCRIGFLRDVVPRGTDFPKLSIIVAARNEGKNIASALQTLLNLDYPDSEVIVVDDRSEDETGQILEELQQAHSRLRVIRINTLPEDFLGKNHALWRGSQTASGDYFLFTDADVEFEASALRRAVTYMDQSRLDHLAATPQAKMPSRLLNGFGLTFGFFFFLFVRPWQARIATSAAHIGIGAFNLVKADVYRQVEGHRAIALRPDDDLKLGKLIKQNGYRQDLLFGAGMLQVEWYDSLRALTKGLEKNLFAGTDYRVWLVLAGGAAHLIGTAFPFVAPFFLSGTELIPWLLLMLLLLASLALSAAGQGMSPFYALWLPFTSLLFVGLLIRTMLLNIAQGGIYWRGTFYALDKLKQNRL